MTAIEGPVAKVVIAIGLKGIETELYCAISIGGHTIAEEFERKWGVSIIEAYRRAVEFAKEIHVEV